MTGFSAHLVGTAWAASGPCQVRLSYQLEAMGGVQKRARLVFAGVGSASVVSKLLGDFSFPIGGALAIIDQRDAMSSSA